MIIAEDKGFFALPEVKRGIIAAGGGAIRLPRRLPPAIAKELLLTGDPISAERAFQLGLVNALATSEDLVGRAMALAARIAKNAPMAVRLSLDGPRESRLVGRIVALDGHRRGLGKGREFGRCA